MKIVKVYYNCLRVCCRNIQFGKLLIFLFLAFSLAFVPVSCLHDAKVSQEEIMYGRRDSVMLSFGYSLNDVAVKGSVNESLVENVNLYVVNELGDVVSYGYYSGNGNSMETVILEKMKYTVYAIANAGRRIHAVSASQIEDIVYRPNDVSAIASPAVAVLMSGKTERQLLTDGQRIVINLTRCVAKIEVKADYSMLNNDVDISVRRVALKNVPLEVSVFCDNKIAEPADAGDGLVIENPSADELSLGLVFYQYENMQGMLLPDNLEQSKKVWPQESIYSKTCSYIELEASYSSPRKRGDILYRFYLGTDMVANFDVIRNRMHSIIVNFREDGAVDENSWRVDNSEIVDLVTSVSVTPSSYKFTELGETLLISATVLPLTAANKVLEWSSSNEDVAIVNSEGVVTAIGDGNCIITATSTDGTLKSASCNIEVDSKIYVTDVIVEPGELELYVGETYNVMATVFPADATEPGVVWSSSDNDVATVDATGKVTALAAGSCTITATSTENASKKGLCRVTVLSTEFSISPTSANLYVGESFTIAYTVKPPVAPVFSSSNTSVATVDTTGKVTALAAGTAKIKATAHGITLECEVTVANPQIEFPASGRVMYDGETVTIPYSKIVPADAGVDISLSNANAQLVSQSSTGITIKAITPGSCIITAKIGPATATYRLDIQKLTITPAETSFTGYRYFRHDIGYTITPSHAAALPVAIRLTSGDSYSHSAGNRVCFWNKNNPEADINTWPSSEEIFTATLYIEGREDVSTDVNFNIKEVSMATSIEADVNLGHAVTTADLQLDLPAHAYNNDYLRANYLKAAPDNDKYPNSSSLSVNLPASTLTIANPCSGNGKFRLKVTIKTDASKKKEIKLISPDNATELDKYKEAEGEEYSCTITLYETVYLIGYAKPDNREVLGGGSTEGKVTVNYVNEVTACFYAHPRSVIFPNGETNVFVPFYYDGVLYKGDHTGKYKTYTFTFTKGQSYPYVLAAGNFTFTGNNTPTYYLNFFRLEPIQKHVAGSTGYNPNGIYTAGVYLNIYSREFCSGFSRETLDWRRIFYYIYGY